ncbi:FadR/GntR family transcriptional regulator [Lentibacillus salicampi]|uniref:FadR family transcriptional regulator n=1 Tax=Lentibacillus salicampi TaxID=175306 RepID=A0A4Y9AGY1_9BACI|nr:FadR/GntR family transcriptional regulator [Lentibacillus salicampi]TFJ94347.1 FadR family transcriptional regulator [Lentibacillus salicampi]
MNYKPIRTKKIYEEISDAFIQMLKDGDLKPGDKLDSVEQLAKMFDVSRPTIREALSGLKAIGLVETFQGEGTYIKTFDASKFALPVATALLMQRENIKELSEVRKILEVGCAGSAAVNHTNEDLLAIETALKAMEDAKGKGELGEKADFDFHLAIAKSTHNDMLIHLMSSVSDIIVESMRETRRLMLFTKDRHLKLFTEHVKIFNAIKHQHYDEAQKAMLDHLVEVDQTLEEYLR